MPRIFNKVVGRENSPGLEITSGLPYFRLEQPIYQTIFYRFFKIFWCCELLLHKICMCSWYKFKILYSFMPGWFSHHTSVLLYIQLLEKKKSLKDVFPECDCKGTESGPWYAHLAYSRNPQELRKILEEWVGGTGDAIRLIPVHLADYEGKSAEQCPVPKWVIRRLSVREKFVVVYKIRPWHTCKSACIVLALLQ